MPNVLQYAKYFYNYNDINNLKSFSTGAVQKDYESFFTHNCENIFIVGKFLTVLAGIIERQAAEFSHVYYEFQRKYAGLL